MGFGCRVQAAGLSVGFQVLFGCSGYAFWNTTVTAISNSRTWHYSRCCQVASLSHISQSKQLLVDNH